MSSDIPNRFYRVSVKALILDETRSKFLILQEESGKWDLPGGGLDWGEMPLEGLKREILEEMGLGVISIKPHPCYFITFLKGNNDIYIANVFYETVLESFDFVPSEECVAFQFVTSEEAQILESSHGVCALGNIFDKKNHATR